MRWCRILIVMAQFIFSRKREGRKREGRKREGRKREVGREDKVNKTKI
jgi:hypothetical protein